MFDSDQLIAEAVQASESAHCRLSGFAVGAACEVVDASGTVHIVRGTNYETSNYRSVCAERAALQNILVQLSDAPKPLSINRMAVYSPSSQAVLTPCGDCRQVLWEANSELQILCCSSDQNYTMHTASELLPHPFVPNATQQCTPESFSHLQDYVVHLPLYWDRLHMLRDLRGLLVTGSSVRASAMAVRSARHLRGEIKIYCQRGESERDYVLYICKPPGLDFTIGFASHGIGVAGVEIVLAEVSALAAIAASTDANPLVAVIRCGTRGTIADVPLGAFAITTSATSDTETGSVSPDENLNREIRDYASVLKLKTYEGPGNSTQFFWRGQSRAAFPVHGTTKNNYEQLAQLRSSGVMWLEMEDFHVLKLAKEYGMAAAAVGCVVARRYDPMLDTFVQGYSKVISPEDILRPGDVAVNALIKYLVQRNKADGPNPGTF